jgi:ribonuclease G
VAILEGDRLMEIYYGHPSQEKIVGNVYKGRVEDVLPGMGSAFVNVGEKQSLFLSQGEINDALLLKHGFKPWQGPAPIGKVVRAGDILVVQVRRAGIGSKNPQGTTKISLPGRFWVFLPTEDRLGVSRRIESVREQRRLRRVAREVKKEGEGLIARTAAQSASDEDLARDYNFLAETWAGVEAAARSAPAPQLLYKGMGLVQTVLRDRLLPDVSEIIVDSPFFHEKILSFLEYMNMSEYENRVRLHREKTPLFEHHHVEEQIQETQSRRVKLAGGGFIVIDETEALTAIDVNTGSDVRHKNQQAAILNTNLEAADEVARQLRLRQISGIIVVDFVDMETPEHIQKVTDRVKEGLKNDRVSADFIDITALGLVEITRKREGESLAGMLENANFDA